MPDFAYAAVFVAILLLPACIASVTLNRDKQG